MSNKGVSAKSYLNMKAIRNNLSTIRNDQGNFTRCATIEERLGATIYSLSEAILS